MYYAGYSLTVSMLTKTKCSAANSRGGEPSNLLCMYRQKRILLLSRQRNVSFIVLGYLKIYKTISFYLCYFVSCDAIFVQKSVIFYHNNLVELSFQLI